MVELPVLLPPGATLIQHVQQSTGRLENNNLAKFIEHLPALRGPLPPPYRQGNLFWPEKVSELAPRLGNLNAVALTQGVIRVLHHSDELQAYACISNDGLRFITNLGSDPSQHGYAPSRFECITDTTRCRIDVFADELMAFTSTKKALLHIPDEELRSAMNNELVAIHCNPKTGVAGIQRRTQPQQPNHSQRPANQTQVASPRRRCRYRQLL